jgi:hypothetical protein
MATQKRTTTSSSRFYHIDGHDLPSVTTILSAIAKPALVKWAENTAKAATMDAAADLYIDLQRVGGGQLSRAGYVATLEGRLGKQKQTDREIAKAQEIGTQAHALVEWSLRQRLGQAVGPRPAASSAAEWAFMAFEDWAASVQLEPLFTEQTVWSIRDGYAGTMDLLARVNGELAVIDFKTSKAVYAEYHLQVAAYMAALEDMGHERPTRGLIVRLPKSEHDPAFEVVAVDDPAALLETFRHVAEVWRWWHAAEEASRAAWKARQQSA